MQAFQTSQYAGWEIDDIDHYDSPERQWYLFELEDPQSDHEANCAFSMTARFSTAYPGRDGIFTAKVPSFVITGDYCDIK